MWIVIVVITLIVFTVGIRFYLQAGERRLLALIRYAFDCYAIGRRVDETPSTSQVPLALMHACSDVAHVYIRTFPSVAAIRARGIERIPERDLRLEIRASFTNLIKSAMAWQLEVSPSQQAKTYQRMFGPNADAFLEMLSIMYTDTQEVANMQVREDELHSLAA